MITFVWSLKAYSLNKSEEDSYYFPWATELEKEQFLKITKCHTVVTDAITDIWIRRVISKDHFKKYTKLGVMKFKTKGKKDEVKFQHFDENYFPFKKKDSENIIAFGIQDLMYDYADGAMNLIILDSTGILKELDQPPEEWRKELLNITDIDLYAIIKLRWNQISCEEFVSDQNEKCTVYCFERGNFMDMNFAKDRLMEIAKLEGLYNLFKKSEIPNFLPLVKPFLETHEIAYMLNMPRFVLPVWIERSKILDQFTKYAKKTLSDFPNIKEEEMDKRLFPPHILELLQRCRNHILDIVEIGERLKKVLPPNK